MQEFGIQLMGKVLAIKEGLRRENGQGMVEYALILGLVSVVCIVALGLLSGKVQDIFNSISTTLEGA
jgi:pilus assembly protein Flp/PilA